MLIDYVVQSYKSQSLLYFTFMIMSFDDHFHYHDTMIHLQFHSWHESLWFSWNCCCLLPIFSDLQPLVLSTFHQGIAVLGVLWTAGPKWWTLTSCAVSLKMLWLLAGFFFKETKGFFQPVKKGLILFWFVFLWEGYLAPGRVAWPAMMLTLDKLECSLLYVVSTVAKVDGAAQLPKGGDV